MAKGPPGQVVPAVLVVSRSSTGRAGLGRGSGEVHGLGPTGSTAELAQEVLILMLVSVTGSIAAWGPKEALTNWISAGWSCSPTVTGLSNMGVMPTPRPATWLAAGPGTMVSAIASTLSASAPRRPTGLLPRRRLIEESLLATSPPSPSNQRSSTPVDSP